MLKNVQKLKKGSIFNIANFFNFWNLNKYNNNLHILSSWSGKLPLWILTCNLIYNILIRNLFFFSFVITDYYLYNSIQFKSQSCMIQISYLIWYKHKSYFHTQWQLFLLQIHPYIIVWYIPQMALFLFCQIISQKCSQDWPLIPTPC